LFSAAKGPAHAFTTTHRTLDRPASRALMAFARRRGLTLATTLHFAWAVWLGARLGSEDVVFGTTVSGRPSGVPGVERIVGLFINNLPIRLQLGSDARPAERLQAIQSLLGQLQSHAHLSPMAIAEAAGGQSGPLFDTLVVVENLASGTSAWSGAEGLTVEAVHSRMKTAYDLTFIAIPGDSIALSLVQPDDGRTLEDASAVLDAVAAILTALPDTVDNRLDSLPRPEARPPVVLAGTPSAQPVRFATRPRSTLEAQIADVVADLSALPQGGEPMAALDLDTDFWFMGVNSLKLIQLAARLEQRLDRAVPISLLLEHRSVSALARAIESGQTWTPVVPMTSAGTGAARGQASDPFVCVHPVAGDVSVFLDLARAMPASIPFWAIQATGLEEGQEPLDSVEALAQANLEALTARGLPHPRWIGGYSFGGIIAFEMARQLAQRGTPPQHIVIIDTPAPLERTSILEADPDRAHAQWLVRMADVRARFQGLEPVLTQDELLALPIAERFALAIERLHAARL
ncbi:MAG TPA: thioesterase domain-containing protein, partial [Castellaniella sp.]|nr:thioesterase domain-containing protein [Castellaniella sp.]